MKEHTGKFTIPDGACFGYYDATFQECLGCRLRAPCEKARADHPTPEKRVYTERELKRIMKGAQ